MRRFVDFVTVIIAIFSITAVSTSFATQQNTAPVQELVFFTWSDYMDPELIKAFENKYAAKVRMVYFENDETRDEMLLLTEAEGYDVILTSGIALHNYHNRNWLASITPKQVPNLKHIDQKWLGKFEDAEGFSVPFFWGTTGIAYRKDLVGYEINSWKQLFEPDEKLHKKILMLSYSGDLIAMALKSLGYSGNSTSPEEHKAAQKLLQQQKPHVYKYAIPALTEESSLVKGEVYAAMIYSGDALMLKEQHPQIEYVLPKEGGNIWVDYLTVSSKSRHPELAYQFINFLNEPKNAAQLAEFVYYATPNKAAEKLLPDEFLKNPFIYPNAAALKNSETHTYIPFNIQKLRNSIYNNLDTQ